MKRSLTCVCFFLVSQNAVTPSPVSKSSVSSRASSGQKERWLCEYVWSLIESILTPVLFRDRHGEY